MKEIGSEFWIEDCTEKREQKSVPKDFSFGSQQVLVFSGRTAIDYVLYDLPKNIKKVYMPSYCCESMLQPFIDRGIGIEYYGVVIEDENLKYQIDFDKKCDIFYANSYFGFSCTTMDAVIEIFRKKGVIVIEDITHRLLCGQSHSNKADYYVASIRKWFAIPAGGLAVKGHGHFGFTDLVVPIENAETKIKAMRKKADYIKSNNGDKAEFLSMFAKFNEELKLNYQCKEIDSTSRHLLFTFDIEKVKKQRIENFKTLNSSLDWNNGLKKFIKPLINEFDLNEDCLLFYPIRVKADLRDVLRMFLASKNIYCPVHWPIADRIALNSETRQVYEEELSLICDQRYGNDEMVRIAKAINEFF